MYKFADYISIQICTHAIGKQIAQYKTNKKNDGLPQGNEPRAPTAVTSINNN